MKTTKCKWLAIALAMVYVTLSSAAQAISVQSQLDSLGGNQYRYVYKVTHDGSLGAGVAVRLFDIEFDPANYLESSLKIVTPNPLNSQWDEAILFSSTLGGAAAYSSFSSTTGIVPGTTVSGFAVEFKWIGLAGTSPGTQTFQIFDPETFNTLERGTTTVTAVPVATPRRPQDIPTLSEWAIILLMLLLVGLAFIEIRKRNNLIGA